MDNDKYESKRFLLPILLLVLISIISVASISSYMTINMYKTHMYEDIEQAKEEYTQKHKNRVYRDVKFVDNSIKFHITKIENKLKESLKEKILIALNVAQYTYDTYKDTLNKEEIKEKIAKALEVIKFNDNRGYYFMYDNKTKVIFGHPLKKFINKNMTNFKDIRGQSLMKLDTEALKNNKIGYSKIYFNKPDDQTKEYPKITCITKFEPLDLVLGIGEYLDVVENRTKEYILDRFSKPVYNEQDRYLVILDVHNFKGGDDFATVLLNSNRPDLVGNKISDKGKDIKGNRFRKFFLDLVKEKGEGYTKYWYKKPSTKTPALKMSFVYLQEDWNWIILSGFYYEDLEKQISTMKESIITDTNNTIYKTLIWVLLLSIISMIIAIIVSFLIDKTIISYTNKIIYYENKKREQESILLQQSKLVSMGEMIGNIAHQWRQPLSIISMDANNMLLDIVIDDLDKTKSEEYANSILKNTKYLSQTIDDFRNFIKGDKNKKAFNLKNNIKSFIHLVDSSIKHNNINLILNLEDNIEIIGHENELTQCYLNIYNNAKDILVENNNQEKLIFISTLTKDNKAIIKIKDNAGGIPNDILPKIFEPYFTTKHKSQGTGLGLHMTYNLIVDGMSGSIEAYNVTYTYNNKSYTGAEFTIGLPLNSTMED